MRYPVKKYLGIVLLFSAVNIYCSKLKNVEQAEGIGQKSSIASTVYTLLTPEQSLSKLKMLFNPGIVPTQEEVATLANTLTGDTQSCKNMVNGWQNANNYNNNYTNNMIVFLSKILEQADIKTTDCQLASPNPCEGQYIYPPNGVHSSFWGPPAWSENLGTSMARTVMDDAKNGLPYTNVLTTTSYMMTTMMMMEAAYKDYVNLVPQPNQIKVFFQNADPTLTPLAAGLTPGSPTYLHFFTNANFYNNCNPNVPTTNSASINIQIGAFASYLNNLQTNYCFNQSMGYLTHIPPVQQLTKYYKDADIQKYALNLNDLTDWRRVTINQTQDINQITPFWIASNLRNSSQLTLVSKKIGFFTTSSFLLHFNNNKSNASRGWADQTRIVALGSKFQGADREVPLNGSAVDTAHATSQCVVCHGHLDPFKQFFVNDLDVTGAAYQAHNKPNFIPGQYAMNGIVQQGNGLEDLANILASDKQFAVNAVQNLCNYVHGKPCNTSDPQFTQVVNDFISNGYLWNDLVASFACSPIGHRLTPILSFQGNNTYSASAITFDQICPAIESRLGIEGACSSDVLLKAIPATDYARGVLNLIHPLMPSYIFVQAATTWCNMVASSGFLTTNHPKTMDTNYYTVSKNKDGTIDASPQIEALVYQFLGLPRGSPTGASIVQALTASYAQAYSVQVNSTAFKALGLTTEEVHDTALNSTFITACQSPWFLGLGF